MNIDFCSQHLLAYDNSLIPSENDIKAKVEENLPFILRKISELKNEKDGERDGETVFELTKNNYFSIPRYSRIPKIKKKTKWEHFAQTVLKKKKNNSGLIYDENSKGWVRRFQKKQINLNKEKSNFVYEYKENDNIYDDPFEEKEEEKEIRKMKQKMREMKNKFTQQGISTQDIKYIQKQKKKKDNLIDHLQMAQISSSTFGRHDKKLKKEKKLKVKKGNITKQKCEKRLLKDEINQNNKLAAIVLKSL
ncbi:nuclear preribosomal assembly protein, putative [Plasmodium ovale]|uniref:Ribosome biogenesis regulatory protein n=2 Tax=Plasmodium ovale TaxID=36330 RepID=A0A1A8VT06_PLAOA|nr:nuclear preribosomal assembly protein, putative [Plasmodium ovale curtisi]SBT00435.1 nuclear preribosomal assembly protein, putative [Plasmodium ovale curtisi]SCP04575.1 nuclear preribosomal assembly protein, putative [Plasmodium ovale]